MKKKALALSGVGFLSGVLLVLSLQHAVAAVSSEQFPLEDLRIFAEVFGRIKKDYVEPVDDKKLIQDAIKGMLTGLDPHSAYFAKDTFKEFTQNSKGEFGGVGIELSSEKGAIKVIAPIEDTPAYHAGLKSGDLITRIDDAHVANITMTEAIKKMRGEPGTVVALTVSRKGEAKSLTFKITRAVIHNRSVRSRLLEPDYGYVRIAQFQENTLGDFGRALKQLYQKNKDPLRGLVLDLRDDPGGVLLGAVGVSAAFLPQDTLVVYTDGRASNAKNKLYARPQDYMSTFSEKKDPLFQLPLDVKTVPVTVLVNAGTASASEIVAGALQDHKRAVLVGSKTFGKGVVQSLIPLANGTGMKLTTSHYYTPKGRSIQAKGIVPDVLVAGITLPKSQSAGKKKTREADLTGHLTNPQDGHKKTEKERILNKTDVLPKIKNNVKKKDQRQLMGKGKSDVPDDYQLSQALNILKAQYILQQKQS